MPENRPPVSTRRILSDFSRHSPHIDSKEAKRKKRKLDYENACERKQRENLRQLEVWTERQVMPFGLGRLFQRDKTPPPSKEEIISLIMHYFPPRNEIFVQVFDFGDGRAERNEIRLGNIEQGTFSARNLMKGLIIQSHAIEAQLGFYQMDVSRKSLSPFQCSILTLAAMARLALGYFIRYE